MSEKGKLEIQRALGYIEGVADAGLDIARAALIIASVRTIDKIINEEEQNDEMD